MNFTYDIASLYIKTSSADYTRVIVPEKSALWYWSSIKPIPIDKKSRMYNKTKFKRICQL